MKLKRSFSQKITSLTMITVSIILALSYLFLISFFFTKEDARFREIAKERTGLSNSYSKARIEARNLRKYVESYDSGFIDFDTLKMYTSLFNSNSYRIRYSVKKGNGAYYPPIPSFLKDIILENGESNIIKNRVVFFKDKVSIINVYSVGEVTVAGTYYISEDPILRKNINNTSLEGFYIKNGNDVVGWLKNGDFYKENILSMSDYTHGVRSKYVRVESNIGVDGFDFIISDKDSVERGNKIITVLGIVFFVIIILLVTLSFLFKKSLAKYLDQVVTDTRILAVKGHNSVIRGKNYKYREFQSLINAFLTVLDTRDSVEFQLIKSKDKMEELIALRTKELTRAVEKAEEANKGKMEFLASVSHEIRTPMNCIIGFCDVIINDKKDAAAVEYARRIINESETLLHLINDILDHSKIESGKMKLEVNRVDIEGFIKNIIALGNPYDNSSNVTLGYDIKNEIPKFVGIDEIRLYQVVSNLYFNALKYTSHGSVSISVTYIDKVVEGINFIEISVIDTGIGIPKERIPTVFDSYEQLEDGLTKGFRGTGLGLTITKKIVEHMNGAISVKSEPGVGSCFTVKVPVSMVEQVESTNKNVIKPVYEVDKPGKILVVEDYPTNRIVARKHLEAAGHIVTEVENGQEAVEICYREKFDLILMDIQMPVMDGFSATIKIRSEGGINSLTPIIAMTANGLQSIKDQCFESGMTSIILKPIRRGSFLETVKKSLKGDVVV